MPNPTEVIQGLTLPFEPAPRQLEVIYEAYIADRFAFFNDVGTGKTFCSTVVALAWGEPQILLLCPPILVPQWIKWLNSIGEIDTVAFRGPTRSAAMLDAKWIVTSHANFRDSFTMIMNTFQKRKVIVIVDEAHALKNVKSVLYRNVNQLIQPDRRVLLLTATPTSKPEDTYTYIKIKTPSVYRSLGQWTNLHVGSVNMFKQITKYENLDLLADNFALNSSKLTKKDIFGDTIPDPIYDPITYELSAKHIKLYDKLADEQLLLLDNGDKIDATSAQKLRHALQQIVVNYEKFSGDEKDRSQSYDLLDTVIDQVNPMEHKNSKLVIWTWYQHTSSQLTAYLKEKFGDKAVTAAYGKVDSAKAVKRIMEDPETRFMIAHPLSVGAGLDLQKVCWEMLFMEMSTTPMHIRQAIGRVDRAGQVNRPTIRFGIAKNTVQAGLYRDLLKNDDLVVKVEKTASALRKMIHGED